mgnify:FL=1
MASFKSLYSVSVKESAAAVSSTKVPESPLPPPCISLYVPLSAKYLVPSPSVVILSIFTLSAAESTPALVVVAAVRVLVTEDCLREPYTPLLLSTY